MIDEDDRYERIANRWLMSTFFWGGVSTGLLIAWLIYLVSA